MALLTFLTAGSLRLRLILFRLFRLSAFGTFLFHAHERVGFSADLFVVFAPLTVRLAESLQEVEFFGGRKERGWPRGAARLLRCVDAPVAAEVKKTRGEKKGSALQVRPASFSPGEAVSNSRQTHFKC